MEENQKQVETKKPEAKHKKKRRRKHYFLRFLAFCAIIAGCVLFLRSDFFLVSKIEVVGNDYYNQAKVVEISGMTGGYNIFKTDTKEPLAKLLADPYISLASVKKKLPKTIEITITERTEYAAVPYGTEYVIIDNEGMVLRTTDVEPALPLLSGMNIIEMTPGKALSVEQGYMLTGTLELIAVMHENDLYFKRIEFSNVVVRAYVYDDLCCKGTPEKITENMAGLKTTLSELYDQGITKGVVIVGSDNHFTYNAKIE